MASNPRLTKIWIQYLKNNQIASLKSDPKTGKLNYKRPVTVEDLFKFLDSSSNFGEEKIMNAIHMVLARKSMGKQQPKLQGNVNPRQKEPQQALPGKVRQEPKRIGHELKRIGHDPQSISDVNYREVSEKISELHYKIIESFQDEQGEELDEKDVEDIFSLLLSQQIYDMGDDETPTDRQRRGRLGRGNTPQGDEQQDSPEHAQEKKEENLRKIKRVIRDTMSPEQRKALWRALNEHLSEEQITKADVKEILKGASALRDNSGIAGKIFKGLRKDKIDVNDLQQAWKEAGFPDDTRDIYAILKTKFGFGDKEIKQVFSQVFGRDDDDDTGYKAPVGSQHIQNIANYARKTGIDAALIDFMKTEFGEELGLNTQEPGVFKRMFGKKAVAEEIRQIFTIIVNEERTDLAELIRQQEQTQFGRIRK